MELLETLISSVENFGTAPLYEDMPRRTLEDKGAAGPTAAHVVEELHTPLNIACTVYTTGTSAFQNPVGVTYEELPARKKAGWEALRLGGVRPGDRMLFSYAPLVNLFTRAGLEEYGAEHFFPRRSERDGFLAALLSERPRIVAGESSFLASALADARKMGLADKVPENLTVFAAGTRLDFALTEEAERFPGMRVYDLYGCQEFGCLTLNGQPLREDITLLPGERENMAQLSVGGLPTGDCFPVKAAGHALAPHGPVLTYGAERMALEWETEILETTARDRVTCERLCRSILRLKAKIVRLSPELKTGAEKTVVRLRPYGGGEGFVVTETGMLDDLLAAQLRYQREKKTDPAWVKRV